MTDAAVGAPIIELRGVNKWYGDFHVLRNINLDVGRGERVVVCGPSGSGKSTMIRCINRLEEHQRGQILVAGIELTSDVKNIEAIRREVGMVFQQFNLFPHLTVLENLTLALIWVRKLPKKEAEETARLYLERVRIPEQAGKYPGQLSGGQQQRAALGKAIARQPQATLLDEPLSNLDLQLRNHLRRQLHLLHRRLRVTMVYVTHDQTEALGLADRIAVMNEGKIHQVGRPESLYNEPATRWVAGFIGWPPINFVEGGMVSLDGQVCFQTGNWLWPLGSSERQLGQAYLGKAITLGIRPEHLDLGKEPAFAMQVVQVETLGSDRLVSLTDGTRQLVGRWARANGIEAGQVVKIGFDMSQVKWFDGVNGLALSFSGNSSG